MGASARGLLTRAARPGGAVGARESWLLVTAVSVGLLVRIVYVVLFRHAPLAGDEVEYDAEGLLIAHGHLFWTRAPYGILHAGAWKAPGYPLWVGLWYALAGHHPEVVRVAQVPLGAVTIFLTWLLGRRLFSSRVAIVAAFVIALYPLAWQYEELLYSESLATPLTLGLLVLIFSRAPSRRRSIAVGGLLGLALLVRPTSELVLAGALVAWGIAIGWRRGTGLTAVAALVAIVVVAPWTVRNAIVMHGFVPISIQDAAAYGTFNPQSASNPFGPWAWQPDPPADAAIFNPHHPLADVALRSQLMQRATAYVEAHPSSVIKAFFWNGLSRLWDVRHRSRSLAEVPFEGRSRLVSDLGLDVYDVLLPLALVGLWRARRRRSLLLGVLAIAFAASVVYTIDSGTRYRAPLEPLIGTLACAGALGARAVGGPQTET